MTAVVECTSCYYTFTKVAFKGSCPINYQITGAYYIIDTCLIFLRALQNISLPTTVCELSPLFTPLAWSQPTASFSVPKTFENNQERHCMKTILNA